MRRLALLISATALACAAFAAPVVAESAQPAPRVPCHDAIEIAKQLRGKYSEAPVAFGLQTNGNRR